MTRNFCIGWCIRVQLNLVMEIKMQFRFGIPELHRYGMTRNSCQLLPIWGWDCAGEGEVWRWGWGVTVRVWECEDELFVILE
jgi:hypothetical protein